MELIERVARAIFRAGFHPDEDSYLVTQKWDEWPADRAKCFTRAKAAIRAMLDGVEPVAWRLSNPRFSNVLADIPLADSCYKNRGWTETPLYSLDALKEAL